MRLWHYELIPILDRQRLLSQHRECCALRGNGWGKKHSTVDYVFKHDRGKLFHYHCIVMQEMELRGYNCDLSWVDSRYRGKNCKSFENERIDPGPYPEHNEEYLEECKQLLLKKNQEYYKPIFQENENGK